MLNNTLKTTLVLLLTACLISACGWRLRGSVALPDGLSAVKLNLANNPDDFERTLKQLLTANGVTLVESGETAQMVMNIGKIDESRRVGGTGSNTLATEYELEKEVQFSVEDNLGNLLLPEDTISSIRTYEFDQNDAVSMEEEQRLIQREMYSDMAQQIVRRLRFVKTDTIQPVTN